MIRKGREPSSKDSVARPWSVKGHSKTAGPYKPGNDRADELAVSAKMEIEGDRRGGWPTLT